MCVYLGTKFQVSSIILTSFRLGVILPPPHRQNEPLKSQPRLGLHNTYKNASVGKFSLFHVFHDDDDELFLWYG